jgi:hypothetical protein
MAAFYKALQQNIRKARHRTLSLPMAACSLVFFKVSQLYQSLNILLNQDQWVDHSFELMGQSEMRITAIKDRLLAHRDYAVRRKLGFSARIHLKRIMEKSI